MRYIFVINLLRNILLGSSYVFWHPRIMIGLTLVVYNVFKSKMAAKMTAVNVKNVCTYKFCLCLYSVYAESSTWAILVITESDVLHITVSVFLSSAGRFSPPVTALFHSMASTEYGTRRLSSYSRAPSSGTWLVSRTATPCQFENIRSGKCNSLGYCYW